jgi:hypothetical protein
MYTLQLWKMMLRPHRTHPLFRRALGQIKLQRPRYGIWLALSLVLGVAVISTGSLVPVLIGILLMAVLLPVGLLAMSGTSLGIYHAWRTGARLSDYRAQGWHPTLGTTPAGWLGVNWVILTSIAHQGDRLLQVRKIVRYVAIFGIVTIGMSLVMTILSLLSLADYAQQVQADERIIIALLPFLVMFVLLYADFVQASIIGGLAGMIGGNSTYDPIDARLRASGLFLLVQFMTYMLSILGWLGLRSVVTMWFEILLVQSILDATLLMVIFYFLRETTIEFLIRWWLWQNQADRIDWQQFTSTHGS